MNIHILVLVIAIILFGLLAFKQMSALILAPLVTSFVIICSGMPILDSLKNLICHKLLFGILCRSFVRSCLPVYWCSRIDRTCDRQFMSRKICSTDHYDHHWFINLWWCQRIRCILCYLPYRT